MTASNESLSRTTTSFTSDQNTLIEVPKKSYEVFKIVSKENNMNIDGSYMDNNGSILVKMYKNTNGRRSNSVQPYNRNNSFEMNNRTSPPVIAIDYPIAEAQLSDGLLMNDKFNRNIFSSSSFNN